MKFELPFEIGQPVWVLLREAYARHECPCANCDGTGKTMLTQIVRVTCRRCGGDGKLFVEAKLYRASQHKLFGITLRMDGYCKGIPRVTYEIMRHISRSTVDGIFATQEEAEAREGELNIPILTGFEEQKMAASQPIAVDYEFPESE